MRIAAGMKAAARALATGMKTVIVRPALWNASTRRWSAGPMWKPLSANLASRPVASASKPLAVAEPTRNDRVGPAFRPLAARSRATAAGSDRLFNPASNVISPGDFIWSSPT